MGTTNVTKHSIKRAKERIGLNKKKAARQIDLAFNRGRRAADFKRTRDIAYLEKKSYVPGTEAVTYNGYCYIFDKENQVCITVFSLPRWFDKKWKASRKEMKLACQY